MYVSNKLFFTSRQRAMKNFEKVLKELDSVSKDFYIGGSLSLFVFNYISRTPKDLDIQTNDEIFLAFAKEMHDTPSIPRNRHKNIREIHNSFDINAKCDPDPAFIYNAQ